MLAIRHRRAALVLLRSALVLSPGLAGAQTPRDAPPVADVDSAKAEAKASFERGIALFDTGAYDAALAEFQRSRRVFPTRSATRNAALALRKLHRFDEALDLVEELLRDPALSDADRRSLAREKDELAQLVGSIAVVASEPDATVLVDGRERGKTPVAEPLRVAAGSHIVRVYKEGFLPFETRVDVAGREKAAIDAKLGALVRGGRLAVSEDRGTKVRVVVDGVETGTTPWEGTLPVGVHTVWLRGEGDIGSPPASVDVRLNQLSKLSLVTEPLPCSIRVEPTPLSARVAIDGVDLGRGVFRGALRCGGHVVELAAEGFVPVTKNVSLAKGVPGAVTDSLERDPNSPLWRVANPPRITFDLRGGPLLGASLGGDLTGGSRGLAIGGAVLGGIGYQLGSGLGVSLDAGFMTVRHSIAQRDASVFPVGLTPHAGTASDDLQVSGPMLGLSVALERGERLVWMGRLGTGVVLGTYSDARTGDFTTPGGAAYSVPSLSERGAGRFAYIAPEARVGLRFGKHVIAELGAQVLALIALTDMSWNDANPFYAGRCPNSDINTCAGIGSYGHAKVIGTSVLVVPTLGLRYEL